MSFSGVVKEELSVCVDSARHCRIANLAALLHGCGEFSDGILRLRTENRYAAGSAEACLRKLYGGMARKAETDEEGKLPVYEVTLDDEKSSLLLMEAVRMEGAYPNGSFRDFVVDRSILRKTCCRKAYLRGAFLLSGSVSNPEKSYHLEIVCPDLEDADLILWIMNSIGFEAKTIVRQKHPVVYLKEGEQISDLLGCMGAPRALMNFENARIERDIAGTVNRRVNCETANLIRTVDASVRQIRDIEFLRDLGELDRLPENLRETALLRLSMPDATLKELSLASKPPVGKSGMNHRLMRLSSIAEKLREEKDTD